MSVNGVTNSHAYDYQYKNDNKKTEKKDNQNTKDDIAAVYESSQSASVQTATMDLSKVNQLKTELSDKSKQMQNLVNALFKGQGNKVYSITDLIKGLRNGTLQVDADTIATAQKEIGEDGYWGVEKTSDRLLEMAKALSGGDTGKADELIKAMEKGFDQATKAAGGKLPDICNKTIETAKQKINDWKASVS